MGIPSKVLITLAIILGIGVGTAVFTFGALMATNDLRDDYAGFIAGGAGLLVGSLSAGVAHLSGGFRDLDDREQ